MDIEKKTELIRPIIPDSFSGIEVSNLNNSLRAGISAFNLVARAYRGEEGNDNLAVEIYRKTKDSLREGLKAEPGEEIVIASSAIEEKTTRASVSGSLEKEYHNFMLGVEAWGELEIQGLRQEFVEGESQLPEDLSIETIQEKITYLLNLKIWLPTTIEETNNNDKYEKLLELIKDHPNMVGLDALRDLFTDKEEASGETKASNKNILAFIEKYIAPQAYKEALEDLQEKINALPTAVPAAEIAVLAATEAIQSRLQAKQLAIEPRTAAEPALAVKKEAVTAESTIETEAEPKGKIRFIEFDLKKQKKELEKLKRKFGSDSKQYISAKSEFKKRQGVAGETENCILRLTGNDCNGTGLVGKRATEIFSAFTFNLLTAPIDPKVVLAREFIDNELLKCFSNLSSNRSNDNNNIEIIKSNLAILVANGIINIYHSSTSFYIRKITSTKLLSHGAVEFFLKRMANRAKRTEVIFDDNKYHIVERSDLFEEFKDLPDITINIGENPNDNPNDNLLPRIIANRNDPHPSTKATQEEMDNFYENIVKKGRFVFSQERRIDIKQLENISRQTIREVFANFSINNIVIIGSEIEHNFNIEKLAKIIYRNYSPSERLEVMRMILRKTIEEHAGIQQAAVSISNNSLRLSGERNTAPMEFPWINKEKEDAEEGMRNYGSYLSSGDSGLEEEIFRSLKDNKSSIDIDGNNHSSQALRSRVKAAKYIMDYLLVKEARTDIPWNYINIFDRSLKNKLLEIVKQSQSNNNTIISLLNNPEISDGVKIIAVAVFLARKDELDNTQFINYDQGISKQIIDQKEIETNFRRLGNKNPVVRHLMSFLDSAKLTSFFKNFLKVAQTKEENSLLKPLITANRTLIGFLIREVCNIPSGKENLISFLSQVLNNKTVFTKTITFLEKIEGEGKVLDYNKYLFFKKENSQDVIFASISPQDLAKLLVNICINSDVNSESFESLARREALDIILKIGEIIAKEVTEI